VTRARASLTLVLLGALLSCTRFGPVYPSRPAPSDGPAIADPPPSRVVAHLTITSDGLRRQLEDAVPKTGDGTISVLGSDRRYTWDRGPLDVGLAQGRIELRTRVHTTLALPIHSVDVPLELRVAAEPVIGSDYAVKLQSVDVHVTSPDSGVAFADRLAGVYGRIEQPIAEKLKAFSYDLKPLLGEAYARVSKPLAIPVGDASACANLRVLDVEAGPTVMAGGLEKDVALVVSPSITLPCPGDPGTTPDLPPLSNVASVASGPFTVTVPIAARYDELTRAMTMAFTDGKLFFSTDYPGLYLSSPELYESQGALVLKLHLAGPVHKMGIDADLDGDLYLTGHPAVVDNELRIPDLEPTIETRNFLLSFKAMTDGDRIRDQARAALRLDIGARIREAEGKLGDELTFGGADACFRGTVDRVEVTGVYAHAAFLRMYVAVTARARADVPCGSVPSSDERSSTGGT
jgi:hypothetical protein